MTSTRLKKIFDEPRHARVDLSQPLSVHGILARWAAPGATDGLLMRKRRILLSKMAATGNIDALQLLSDRLGCALGAQELHAAAAAGHLHVCKWTLEQGHMEQLERWSETMTTAASAGQQAVVVWGEGAGERGKQRAQNMPLATLCAHCLQLPGPPCLGQYPTAVGCRWQFQ